jgi:hypothetical protein
MLDGLTSMPHFPTYLGMIPLTMKPETQLKPVLIQPYFAEPEKQAEKKPQNP